MLNKLVELLKPSVSTEAKLKAVSVLIGTEIDKTETRLVSLEERQLQKGEKGDSGKDGIGKDGKSGKDGKDGIGLAGKDGKDAKAKDGKDGVSVVGSWIAADGNFVFKLSNGKEIDAGNPMELESFKKNIQINTQLAKNQITVSATAPVSPSVNDLWYDLT